MSSIIPGAYARAAGVQSEINKVTVTRVAGSEVEFRRTIDTYQKDLRYNVNQIGREQRLLRRSLKRYSKKLLDSKKLRQQRQAKAKEQADRHIKEFREAERSLENNVPLVNPPDDSYSRQLDATQVYDSENDFNAEQQPNTIPALPDSPDSGVGSETEETVPPGSTHNTAQSHDPVDNSQACRPQKAFLTSSKGKPPYLKAKRGGRINKQEPGGDHQIRMSSAQDCAIVSARLSDSDELLPSITEENEDGVDQFKFSASAPDEVVAQQQKPANEHRADSQTSSSVGTQPPVITSLDTKSVSQAGKIRMQPSTPAHSTNVTKPDEEDNRVNAEGTGVQVTRKKPRRKTGVSYGDLIKLQHTHTSSTKQLFELVDRLASVHGIADPPVQPPSSTPSSLDPRNNVKIKHKLNATRASDGIVKQAAVLYPMKYGYSIPDSQSDVARSPAPQPLETSNHSIDENGGEVTVGCRHSRRSVPRIPDIVLHPTRRSRHSVRRDSTDVTSPFYEFTEAASSIFDDFIFQGRSPPPRRNKGKPLTLTELSVQATKIRERTLHGSQISQDGPEPIDNNPAQPSNTGRLKSDRGEPTSSTTQAHRPRRKSRLVSPGTRRSRRRDSVQEQLQRRLNDGEEVEKMAWQSAFGRLKMIHTLYDLSQHFQ